MALKCSSRSRSRTPPGQRRCEVVWEILLDHGWVEYDTKTNMMFREVEKASGKKFEYRARGNRYMVDIQAMHQVNIATNVTRPIRRIVLQADQEDEFSCSNSGCASRSDRLKRLITKLTSGTCVQVKEVALAEDVPSKLNSNEVAKVFTDNVPGVSQWLYREHPGVYAIKFIQEAYKKGFQAFRDTPLHNHLLCLLRLIVHHGHEHRPNSARYLRDVAEAFMDCQAVQARVVEKVGLQIRGVELDFRGQVVALVGEYKTMAVKMLAADMLAKRGLADDPEPTHFENRLISDLGNLLGLNMDDIRRAELDEHAKTRFPAAATRERNGMVKRLRELYDMEALLKAFSAELQSFGADSAANSLARLFIDWASERMTDKHLIFDAETCTKLEITDGLALAIFEVLFLGKSNCPPEELHRGKKICELFPENNSSGS